jgi:hypothetical protein
LELTKTGGGGDHDVSSKGHLCDVPSRVFILWVSFLPLFVLLLLLVNLFMLLLVLVAPFSFLHIVPIVGPPFPLHVIGYLFLLLLFIGSPFPLFVLLLLLITFFLFSFSSYRWLSSSSRVAHVVNSPPIFFLLFSC